MPSGTYPTQYNALIVDDDPITRHLVRRILEGAGFVVEEAATVAAGFERARAILPHVIILDLWIPEEDGFAFLSKRQGDIALSKVPVIVLSGAQEQDAAHSAMAEGAAEFLHKPIQAALLLQKIHKQLRNEGCLGLDLPGDGEDVTVTVPAEIVAAGESGFVLESTVRVASDGQAAVRWTALEQAGLNTTQIKRTRTAPRSTSPGRYQSKFDIAGANADQLGRFRQSLERTS